MQRKQGRPRTQFKQIDNESERGTLEGETRATFIIRKDQVDKIKKIAYWERLKMKDVLIQAIDNLIKSYELKNGIIQEIPGLFDSQDLVIEDEPKNLLLSLHTNGKAFVKDVFSKYKFAEFNVKQLEDFRFQHRIIDVWSTFDTLCARGVMSKQYAQGEKAIGKKGNTYKFILDISNQ
jgi:hypothetical protein